MDNDKHKNDRAVEVLIHACCWGLVFSFPFLFMIGHDGRIPDWGSYLKWTFGFLCYLIVFYINYLYLIPKAYFDKKIRFAFANAVLICVFSLVIQLCHRYVFAGDAHPPRFTRINPIIIFFIRDAFMMILVIGLATALRLNREWQRIENMKQEAEQSRTRAELTNLRNQLNPHFLLNTLNNIYALIAFDSDKAQSAVQELSRLLRYVLYDNQSETVPLSREMEFNKDYISLMKIRVAGNVEITTDYGISPDTRKMIAPLLFISLIENAFKHGVSPVEPSFIRISFSEAKGSVRCLIVNSYHPKTESDKSGSGIGLESVRRRLELLYPGGYNWTYGPCDDGKNWSSDLEIKL